MAEETPGPTPEGRLIEEAAKVTGRSIRQLAANAGMSDTRWRQIVRGWQENSAGKVIEARASFILLARMAYVVGVTPEQLTAAGRADAADALERILRTASTHPDPSKMLLDVEVVANTASGRVIYQAIKPSSGASQLDEIDLIYASNMSAREKLLRIRQVLELRAQAEAEETRAREKAPPPAEEADAGAQETQSS